MVAKVKKEVMEVKRLDSGGGLVVDLHTWIREVE
jgi:hypothetical protein